MSLRVPEAAWWERLLSSGASLKRRALKATIVLGLLALPVFLLHAYLNSDSVTFRLRDKVEGELSARGVGVKLGAVEVDWLGRITLRGFRLPTGSNGATLLTATAVRVRPSYRMLLQGKAQAASVRFEDLDLFPGPRGEAVRDFLAQLKQSRPSHHASGAEVGHEELPVLIVRGGFLHVEAGGPITNPFDLGPLDGEVSIHRTVELQELEGHVNLNGGGAFKFDAQWGVSEPVKVEAWAEDVHPDVVPESLRAKLPVFIEEGTFSFHARAEGPPGLRTGAMTFSTRADGLVVAGDRLAGEPVGPWSLGGSGTIRWDRGRQKVRLDDGEVFLGAQQELKVGLGLEAAYVAPFNFRFDAHIDKLPYQAALDALPPQLTPGPNAPRLEGPLSAQVSLQGELRDPEQWTSMVNLDISKLKETAKGTPFKLKGPFLYQPRDMNGPVHDVWVGDKNPAFTPLSQVPAYVYRAVTTSEDAGFFGHHGFDFMEMKNTFVSVASDKRFRGASTITQQLAKNLFLSKERTYARKVQEALITIALEASLPKQRLLELYMNIIEWGPGVYGIGEAAAHYFGKDPRALTVKQATFLATIIPNPIKYHVYFSRGELTDTWQKRVADLLTKMRDQGIIDEAQYQEALRTPLAFRAEEGRARVTMGGRRGWAAKTSAAEEQN